MCGICGAISFSDPEFLADVREMLPMMARRGPDDEGSWNDASVALGFRRLSILDLSNAGHQPMLTEGAGHALVFNGEVYNFRELRAELEGLGIRFRSRGDTEVVLQALAFWGRTALDRFNGMFALAFYDRGNKKLLLARDHAGIKPLYYLKHRDGLVFASQYDQILAHRASRDLPISQDALALYLRLAFIPAPYGMLEQTHMLEAGCWLEVDAGGALQQGRYFSFPRSGTHDLRGEEAHEAVDVAVTESVRRQLVSDVPVGSFLSGGVDSPLVTAKIQQVGAPGVKAFTIGTQGDAFDESEDARAYARALGVEQVLEQVSPEQSLELLDDVVEASSEPFADFSLFPTLLVSKLARREVSVMLSGDGGDELFWGYARRFGSVLEQANDFAQPLWWRKGRWAAKKWLNLGGGYPQLTWPSIGPWYRSKQSHLHDDWLRRIFPDCPAWPEGFPLFDYTGSGCDETADWMRWNEYTGRMTMILAKVDRASMFHSLEVRVPLLDRQVVETAARVDWQSCLDLEAGRGKLPLRHALSRHVRYQTHAKKGFTVPMDVWLRGPLRPIFEERLLSRQDLLGIPVNTQAIGALYQRLLDGQGELSWGLWSLLSLALWEKRYYSRRSRATG